MASAFSHALAAIAIGKTFPQKKTVLKFFTLGCVCSVIPDADVITFNFGISYDSFFGHRGFFHSLTFSLILSLIVTTLFYRNERIMTRKGFLLILFFFLCTASHALLDMITDGGRGVALFAPFDNTRYFFLWRPVKVSPLGINKFFSEYGWKVIKSEIIWIGIPSTVYMICLGYLKKK